MRDQLGVSSLSLSSALAAVWWSDRRLRLSCQLTRQGRGTLIGNIETLLKPNKNPNLKCDPQTLMEWAGLMKLDNDVLDW